MQDEKTTSQHRLQDAIVKTVAYFDLFDYPLTLTELWQWLWHDKAVSLPEVEDEVVQLLAPEKLERKEAFYTLPHRQHFVSVRHERYRHAVRKMRRAKRLTWWFAFLPWVEGVAACNSLGYQNTRDESDIDFLIVCQPGTLWLVRFCLVSGLKLFGLRPTSEHARDTACLSFFLSRNALDLSSLRLPSGDPYLTYWVTQLTPLFGRGELWHEFHSANQWIRKQLPNVIEKSATPAHWAYQSASRRGTASGLVAWFAAVTERMQRRRLPVTLTTLSEQDGTEVVLNDAMLKFHRDDARAAYRDKWQKQMTALSV